MLLDEILVNLNESAEAEHPENCDCPECKAKRAEKCEGEECMEECSEAQDFWKETGIEESEDKELSNLNDKMRKLMKKRSECASGSAKQEKINDQLDKIYDRRHELMSKKTLNEDGEGTKVLEALEDINEEGAYKSHLAYLKDRKPEEYRQRISNMVAANRERRESKETKDEDKRSGYKSYVSYVKEKDPEKYRKMIADRVAANKAYIDRKSGKKEELDEAMN